MIKKRAAATIFEFIKIVAAALVFVLNLRFCFRSSDTEEYYESYDYEDYHHKDRAHI